MGRARRAWLPPSATWLFRPRNATHTTGLPHPGSSPLHLLAVQARQADDRVNHISVEAQLQAREFAQELLRVCLQGAGTLSGSDTMRDAMPLAGSTPHGSLQQRWCCEQPSRPSR